MSCLVRNHTSTSTACLKQVSRRLPLRVPRARRSARNSLATSRTNSRGTLSMARYAITWGPRHGLDLVEENLPTADPTYLPATARRRRVAPPTAPILLRSPHYRSFPGGLFIGRKEE